MRTPGSRNRATPEKRKRILQTALELFLASGLTGTTLDQLCSACEISRSSFYHHFVSKEAVAVTLYSEAIEAIHRDIRAALGSSLREGLEGMLGAYLDWFEAHPRQGAFVWKVMSSELMAVHIASVAEQQRLFHQEVIEWLEPFVRRGQARRLSAPVLVALVIGPARDFVRSGGGDFRQARVEFARAAYEAVRAQR
ncbi:MAG: TetR/AcrR family transcriptional regulator [Candidatus Eremiobacteraeota bacterium]|nr:TetR/AcrR family transcriptional regulator [Candidatus Eremiobacteraeota bacterium]MCW5872013.1 TetR/AcrR family transcriptional regulator [Candidatus Eremiobacteraeota bacterium]